jgi:hypothetical protein
MSKTTKKTRKPVKSTSKSRSKSEKKRVELSKDSTSRQSEDVKYRLTFLVGQMFKGEYYKKGTVKEVPEWVAKAYSKRSMLKFEKI